MPSQCVFNLNSATEVYIAGENYVEGTVTLKTTNPKHILSIDIHFTGGSKVGFYRKAADEVRTCDHQNKTYYTSKVVYVTLHERVREEDVLQAGTYSWPFRFYVPRECLTSVESTHGNIRYELCLEICNQGQKYKNIFLKPVTVIRTFDLERYPQLNMPIECEHVVTSCMSLFRGSIEYMLSIPYGAYAPGQLLKFILEVHNKHLRGIARYDFTLRKKTIVIADNPGVLMCSTDTIVSETHIQDNRLNDQTAKKVMLIPSTAPTTPPSSRSKISVSYTLMVEAKVSCCNSKFKAELPIVIGTLPYRDSLTHDQINLIEAIREERAEGTVIINYKLRVPSYENSLQLEDPFKDIETDKRNRVDEFCPKYPMFTPDFWDILYGA